MLNFTFERNRFSEMKSARCKAHNITVAEARHSQVQGESPSIVSESTPQSMLHWSEAEGSVPFHIVRLSRGLQIEPRPVIR